MLYVYALLLLLFVKKDYFLRMRGRRLDFYFIGLGEIFESLAYIPF